MFIDEEIFDFLEKYNDYKRYTKKDYSEKLLDDWNFVHWLYQTFDYALLNVNLDHGERKAWERIEEYILKQPSPRPALFDMERFLKMIKDRVL